jgi:hypothetical protein
VLYDIASRAAARPPWFTEAATHLPSPGSSSRRRRIAGRAAKLLMMIVLVLVFTLVG